MICEECGKEFNGDRCACGWPPDEHQTAKPKGQSLRLNDCDVPGCYRVVSAGNHHGFHFPTRCRFHRDPNDEDPPHLHISPRIPSTGPLLTFDQVKEDFERIKAASAKELHVYWRQQGISPKKPGDVKL